MEWTSKKVTRALTMRSSYVHRIGICLLAFLLSACSFEGYKFNGWFDLDSGKKVTSIPKGSTENRNLYAYFTPVTYKVTYNLNKGKLLVKNSKAEKFYDVSFDIEKETFDFCFEGIPQRSIVSISTIGVKRNKEALKIWKDGVDELIKRIKPSTILIYGGKLNYDYGDIQVIYYENKVTENLKNKQK